VRPEIIDVVAGWVIDPVRAMRWHLYSVYDPEDDFFASVIIGPTQPDSDEQAKALTFGMADLNLAMDAGQFAWVASWGHEPSEEELDEHRPPGHRSTDVEEEKDE
jgi:hypothetical protein